MAKVLANCKSQSRERAKNIIKSIFQKENIFKHADEHLDHLKRPELISFINANTYDKDSYSIKGDELGFCYNKDRNKKIGDTFLTKFIKNYCGSTIVKFNEVMKDGFVVDFAKEFRERLFVEEIEHNLGMAIPFDSYGFEYQKPGRLEYLKDIFIKKNIPLPKKQSARELLNELARRFAYQPIVTPTILELFPREMIPYAYDPICDHIKIVLCGQPIVSIECCSITWDEGCTELKESIENSNYGRSSTDVDDEIEAAYVSAFNILKYADGKCYTYHFDFGILVDLLDRAEIIKDSNELIY